MLIGKLKRSGLLMLLMIGGWVQAVPALELETVRVMVLPFKINAHTDLAYLETDIPRAIERHLEINGATLIDPPARSGAVLKGGYIGTEAARRWGRDHGADHVVWGSMTRIGNRYSLDARLLTISGTDGTSPLFAVGEGIENLPKTIKELVADISIKIFKKEQVARVIVTGNHRIEADAIKKKLQTAPGEVFLPKSISEDLKTVYQMGHFDDIRIEAEDGPGGKTVIFHVKEKPIIRKISFTGNKAYSDKEIFEVVEAATGEPLSVYDLKSDAERIKTLFKEKRYHYVAVTYEIEELRNNQCDLRFNIEEGVKLAIRNIVFKGVTAFSEKKLKKVMKTKEKGFFSFVTSSGELNQEDLKLDMAKLATFYKNEGFINVKLEEPVIEYEEKAIAITIKIGEGPRFKMGRVNLSGELIMPRKALVEKLKLTRETYYNHQALINDKIMLTDLYADQGYANVDVVLRIEQHPEDRLVDVFYDITKGKQVYFEKILITGNTKTRDKIIRRELKVHERELYSATKLAKSARKLYRMDYFEDIDIDTTEGSAEDKMILSVAVSEKSTGTFSIGGGYSSVEKFYLLGSVTQRNLFGRGQTLDFKGQIGGTTDKYTMRFTEPWLFDIPLLGGFDLFKTEKDYEIYDKKSVGGGLRTGYLIFDYTRVYLAYNYDITELIDIDDSASTSIKALEGENTTSSIRGSIGYDSRNRLFNPSEGQNHSIAVEYAGLGGDIAFLKYLGEAELYFPLLFGLTGFIHGEAGYVEELPNGILPDYERFYLGGINSLRGFKWREIGTTDEDGAKIGGEKYMQFNAEVIVPLFEDAGLYGVVFFDTGNVFDQEEAMTLGDLRQTAGFGFRWYSPLGPLRLENGYIIDRESGEDDNGRWEFSFGIRF